MAFASQFELIATIIKQDRYLMEEEEHGIAELLTKLLRACHDYSGSTYPEGLGDSIASLVLEWVSDSGLVLWPEEEGSGLADWAELDRAAETLPLTLPGTLPGTLPPLTGGGL